jgi:tetratricopeptide (TPR) repeat protein
MAEEVQMVSGLIDVPQVEVGMLMEAAYLYMELGKFKEAQDVFAGIAALVPHSEIPVVGLGNLFFAQGKFSQALKQHQEALKINPDSALAQAHVGEALLFMKKNDDGVKALNKAIEMEPEGLASDFAKVLLELNEEEGLGA